MLSFSENQAMVTLTCRSSLHSEELVCVTPCARSWRLPQESDPALVKGWDDLHFLTPMFCSVICNGNIIDLSSSIWLSVVFYNLDSSRLQCDLIRHLIQKCLPHLVVSFLLNILIKPISTSMRFPRTLSLLLLANLNLTFPRGSINASSAMISLASPW